MTTPEVSAIRDADRIIGLLEANEIDRIDLIINRLRMGMVKRGDMMSVEDVVEILSVNLLGAIPDDDSVVIATNQGEALAASESLPDRHFPIFVAGYMVKRFHLWILNRGMDSGDILVSC